MLRCMRSASAPTATVMVSATRPATSETRGPGGGNIDRRFGNALDPFQMRGVIVLHDRFATEIALHLGNVVLKHGDRGGSEPEVPEGRVAAADAQDGAAIGFDLHRQNRRGGNRGGNPRRCASVDW